MICALSATIACTLFWRAGATEMWVVCIIFWHHPYACRGPSERRTPQQAHQSALLRPRPDGSGSACYNAGDPCSLMAPKLAA